MSFSVNGPNNSNPVRSSFQKKGDPGHGNARPTTPGLQPPSTSLSTHALPLQTSLEKQTSVPIETKFSISQLTIIHRYTRMKSSGTFDSSTIGGGSHIVHVVTDKEDEALAFVKHIEHRQRVVSAIANYRLSCFLGIKCP